MARIDSRANCEQEDLPHGTLVVFRGPADPDRRPYVGDTGVVVGSDCDNKVAVLWQDRSASWVHTDSLLQFSKKDCKRCKEIREMLLGSAHEQIFDSWRRYPKALLYTLILGLMVGSCFGTLAFFILR